jgi:hypothetical protein
MAVPALRVRPAAAGAHDVTLTWPDGTTAEVTLPAPS